jgi:hypothetical protein
MVKSRSGLASAEEGQLVECDRHPPGHWFLHGKLIVPASEVLHQRMPGDHDPGGSVSLEPPHRTQSRLEAAMVGLDVVVGIPIGVMPRRWKQLL